MTTTAEKVAGILKFGLREAEESHRSFGGHWSSEAAYDSLSGAIVAALALLGEHVEFDASEAEQALRDDDRAKEGWR